MIKQFSKVALAPCLLLAGLPAMAANWALEPAESTVSFKYSYEGTPYEGEFRNVEALFDIDPINPGSCQFSVTIPIADICRARASIVQFHRQWWNCPARVSV